MESLTILKVAKIITAMKSKDYICNYGSMTIFGGYNGVFLQN